MMVTRRLILGVALCAAALGAGAIWRLVQPQRRRDIFARALSRAYGPAIGNSPPAQEFLTDLDLFFAQAVAAGDRPRALMLTPAFHTGGPVGDEPWLEGFAITQFALSSNVISAAETGEPLEYLGVFDPLSGPCTNPLSAFNAPD